MVKEITVYKPRKSLVSGDEVALVGICRRDRGAGSEKFRLIGVDRVRSAEFLPDASGSR